MDPHERAAAPSSAVGLAQRRERRAKPSESSEMDSRWLTDHALRYIARWESSTSAVGSILERRIRERCSRTGEDAVVPLERIPEVLGDLVDHGYVDDQRYARSAVGRMRRQGRSSEEIRSRLATKGVDDSIVRDLLGDEEPDSDRQAAWRLAKRRRLGPFCRDPERRQRDRNRQLGVLARHGFDRETVEAIVDARCIPDATPGANPNHGPVEGSDGFANDPPESS